MTGFRKLDEHLLHDGHVISLATVRYEDPEGGTFEREVVHHPGAVSVVPVTDEGLVVMVRQFRVAVDDDVLEIPAGKRDVPGEDGGHFVRLGDDQSGKAVSGRRRGVRWHRHIAPCAAASPRRASGPAPPRDCPRHIAAAPSRVWRSAAPDG